MRVAMGVMAILLAGCASKIQVPVTGQLDDGTPAAGMATAMMSGEGNFWIKIPGGPRCDGTYDAFSSAPTIVVPATCDDGRAGEVIITRQLNMTSGTAIAQLEDGTRGQFVFGDLTFEQAFGTGGASTPGRIQITR